MNRRARWGGRPRTARLTVLVGALCLALACATAPAAQAAGIVTLGQSAGGEPAGTGPAERGAQPGGASAPAAPGRASATLTSPGASPTRTTAATDPNAPVPVPDAMVRLAGRRLSAHQVLAIADRLPKVRSERAKFPGSYRGAYLKGPARWQVSYFSRSKKEVIQIIIDDARGRVLEQWTGFQVAWTMARGYPGAFGRHVDALYVWLPLSVLFLVPFINWRRPRSLLHLDLLALSLFSVSLAFFNHANIGMSTPLVYPPLVYLLARMLIVARAGRRRQPEALLVPERLRLAVPVSWLAVATVFLIGFRVGLNIVDSNVIDVGYAGVIGAHRIVHGQSLYGGWPTDNAHGDTYGPASYEAYIPFLAAFGWSGRWDDLPAAHAAAIFFDLLAVALLFLLGRRVRGPTLGVALAYAWVAYPFTLFSLDSNTNDALVAVLILGALLAGSSVRWRGALGALAGLTKFAPLALAPVLATHGWRADGGRWRVSKRTRVRLLAGFAFAFAAAAAVAMVPALTHSSLHTFYERTFAYQSDRHSPFSVWGLYGGLGGEQAIVQAGAVLLALALALTPRRADLVGLAAVAAAVLIAVQLGVDHWFYLYLPWFFGLVIFALLGRYGEPSATPEAASGPARSRQLVAA